MLLDLRVLTLLALESEIRVEGRRIQLLRDVFLHVRPEQPDTSPAATATRLLSSLCVIFFGLLFRVLLARLYCNLV